MKDVIRNLAFAALLTAFACEEPSTGIEGTWSLTTLQLSGCNEPSANKTETCDGCGLGICSVCNSYTFGSSGFYSTTNLYGVAGQSGRYTAKGGVLTLTSGGVTGDYEYTVTGSKLTLIQRNWPIYTGDHYVFCTQTETYTRH